MAIDTFITLTVDPSAGNKQNRSDHVHVAKRGTANGGDITLAFDKAKVGSKAVMNSAMDTFMRVLAGGNELSG